MNDSICIIRFGSGLYLYFPAPRKRKTDFIYVSFKEEFDGFRLTNYFMKSRFQLVILFIILLLSACQGSDGAFGPIFPTPTQIGIVNQEPVPVDFETFNSDPSIFVDRFVRVTGRYVPKRDAICTSRQRGPSIEWFLISGGFQMEMSGFGSVVELAPEQAFFTIDGIWRQYTGPVGCAKEPVEKTIWYLEVVRIIEPNPLVASADSANRVTIIAPISTAVSSGASGIVGTPPTDENLQPVNGPTAIATPSPTVTPLANGPTPAVNPTATPFVVATPLPAISPTPLATSATGARATATPTPRATVTPVPSASASPTATATPVPTSDGSGDDGDGLGGTGGGTPNPATPVPTPIGGYPGSGQPATPVPSPPPGGY